MQASDPAAAAAWLWRATSRGNPEAPIRLADMYIKGKGVPHSCEQALVLLRSEAGKENAPARNRLAALYANGTCVARDRVRAYQLMSSALAVDPTSEWAETNRKELWRLMTPEERVLAGKYR
jgi:TPR repeat protein